MDTARETGRSAVMSAIDHVLAPLDGSAQAEAALHWLRFLPLRRLTLLRACDGPSSTADQAEGYLAAVASRLTPPECVVETRVVIGRAAESIVAAAAAADLVIMCSRANGGGGRLLFGSVADRVARHSPTPTVLLRYGSVPMSGTAVHRVVVPLDGSGAAQRALPPAIALARSLNCPIHLVSVCEPDDSHATTNDPATTKLMHNEDEIKALGLAASSEQRSGEPAHELLDAVSPGDLLVITTHGRGAARRWQIGSVAEKLLRQATAPVVLVRADTP